MVSLPPLPGQCFWGCLHKRKRDKRSKPSSNIKQPTQQLPDISTPFALLSRQNSIDQSEKQHYATRINTVFAVLHVDETNGIPSLSPRVLTPVTFMTPVTQEWWFERIFVKLQVDETSQLEAQASRDIPSYPLTSSNKVTALHEYALFFLEMLPVD